jgi:hypothetical protein
MTQTRTAAKGAGTPQAVRLPQELLDRINRYAARLEGELGGAQIRLVLLPGVRSTLSYRIEFVRSAAKAYARLAPTLQRRVDRELTRLCESPRHPGVIRLQSDDELYRVRIPDLRLFPSP